MEDVNKIPENYKVEFEGQTNKGIFKKIFAIIGNIYIQTYRRFIDKEGVYLSDKDNNQLLIKKDYSEDENS